MELLRRNIFKLEGRLQDDNGDGKAVLNCGISWLASAMHFQKITFDSLFSLGLGGSALVRCTNFGFESEGKRYFSVAVPGMPRITEGMTVIALLENPDALPKGQILGWVDCRDGSIACDRVSSHLVMCLLGLFWAMVLPPWAQKFVSPENAKALSFFLVLFFGGFSLDSLYSSVKAFLVKSSLEDIRPST